MELTADNVKKINDFMFFDHDDTISADLGLVMGCKSISPYVADEALKLYQAGRIKKIAISGGMGCFDPITIGKSFTDPLVVQKPWDKEADVIERYLLENGVKPEDIVNIDRKAKHTGHNIEFSLETIKQFKSTLLIAPAYNQRRALGTFRKWLPDIAHVVSAIAVYPMGLNKGNWAQAKGYDKLVVGEYLKVDPKNDDLKTSYILQGLAVHADPSIEAMRLKKAGASSKSQPASPQKLKF